MSPLSVSNRKERTFQVSHRETCPNSKARETGEGGGIRTEIKDDDLVAVNLQYHREIESVQSSWKREETDPRERERSDLKFDLGRGPKGRDRCVGGLRVH